VNALFQTCHDLEDVADETAARPNRAKQARDAAEVKALSDTTHARHLEQKAPPTQSADPARTPTTILTRT
jgi:hypothetical protein